MSHSIKVVSHKRHVMSDNEDADYFMEHWTSPPKRKVKKDAKKNKKTVKHKKNRPTKTHDGVQKKKKNATFKEPMMENRKKRKEKDKNKKKEKKKKKSKLALNPDDFKFTESFTKFAAGHPCLNEKLNSFPETSVKEPKRKKMVAFDSLPSYIRIKRPIFTSSSPIETKAVREDQSCSQVMGKSQIQTHDNDFQNNSDINSQDLFITQKTFRASPSETSSGEASDGVISESPHVFTQRDKNRHTTAGEIGRCNETSDKGQDRATYQCLREIKRELEEENYELLKHSGKISFQTNQAGENKVSVHEGPKLGNSFLNDPLVINPTPDAILIQNGSSYHPFFGELPVRPALASTSTQTENFFTTELSSYLSFHRKNRVALQSQDMKPLDLSLPQRSREDLHVSVKMLDVDIKQEVEKCHEQLREGEIRSSRSESMSASSRVKSAEIKKETSCHGESTPSPQSEAETKSANTTSSSEDDHHCRAGKRDLTQVTPFQLRHLQSYSIN
ncbi:hypothetical protein AMECASPLE_033137 [Ameca splendens]|uniref:Uncharacterized protein n=1 Tax=Ameca splendens TaxID=208324 RepID=A0ABV0Y6P8_9TELE